MLSEAVDNPVFLRQVIENYKLRVIFANLSACSILLLCAINLEKERLFFSKPIKFNTFNNRN